MSDSGKSSDLFPEARNPENVRAINNRCMVRTQEGHAVVVVSGVILAQYDCEDRMAEAHAMVSLVEQGLADQVEVARAFDCSARTIRRHQQRFAEGGLAALGRKRGYPLGRARLAVSRQKRIEQLKAQGCSGRQIASILGVTERAVRKVLRRRGLNAVSVSQTELKLDESTTADPKLSASLTHDADPTDRRGDRLLASLGLLEDAPPLFGSGQAIPRAGVLLAIPALVRSGVFRCAQKTYGSIGPAFYGLRTSLLTLLLMALWRIKRPEGLKEYSPEDLGRVLGLDRAPEVKTLRRKLTRLSQAGQAAQFGRALAEARVAAHGDALGFLYVDGHVRVYHGKHPLPKTHVARRRLSMPATSDYWVNDAHGEPLLVITAEANAGLVKMLPSVLAQVRSLIGSRRTTVVFDRGGFSPKLFRQIIEAGFDLLTYP